MIGLRIGIHPVPGRHGMAIGLGEDETAPLIGTVALSVAINDSTDPVMTSENYSYSVIATNAGPFAALNVSVVVICPTNSTFVSASGSGWTCNNVGHTVTCTRPLLGVGASPTITIAVTSAAAAETSSATANATADNATPAVQDIETTGVLLVTKDAIGGKRFPADATEWANVSSRCGFTVLPYMLWLCQDVGPDLADAIGSFPGVQTGTAPTYRTAVSGFTRKALQYADGSNGFMWNASGSEALLSTTSHLTLACLANTTNAVEHAMVVVGSSGTIRYRIDCSSTPTTTAVGAVTDGIDTGTATGTHNINDAVHPIAFKYDRTNSVCTLYTDKDVVNTDQFRSMTGRTQVLLGSNPNPAFQCLYLVCFHGSNAELTDGQIRILLTILGWTVLW